ncbi:MAG: hypothetical protein EHM61_08890 [Acidobacteria bacterium]|nr:MAG: hypothetical protein EHM61_08890 [Acidobacteriota bacterium]
MIQRHNMSSAMRIRYPTRFVLMLVALSALMGAEDRQLRHKRRVRAPSGPVVALVNGTLIDGTGADPVADAVVLIQSGRIAAVGPSAAVALPPNADRIDLGGGFILPGFINAHVHNALRKDHLQTWASEGVTTVRDVGAAEPYVTVFRLRDTYQSDPLCARLVAAGPLVTVPGGYPLIPNQFPAMSVLSAEDARAKISQLLDAGADFIKITLEPGADWPVLTLEQAEAIVETAHVRPVPVTVHATQTAMYRRALDAGVDDICHSASNRLSDDMIAEMVQAGVCMVPTLTAQKKAGETVSNLRRFVAAGGKVALGNDGGYLAGLEIGMPITELEAMREAGMSPMQVILAATKTAAEICRLDRDLGTLQPGKRADILVVDQNPLENLRALLNVTLVMHSGVVIFLR